MTELDPTSDDEIVSAYLDGEATPEERARVENDPRLTQRLEEFRRTSRAVGTPHFFPDAPGRDALLSRALAAAGSPAGGADVVPIDRARRRRRLTVALSAAAAVVLGLIALPQLQDERTAQDQVAATIEDADAPSAAGAEQDVAGTGDDTAGSNSAPPATEPAEGTASGSTPASTMVPPSGPSADTPDDLGAFPDRRQAQVAVTAAIDAALARDTPAFLDKTGVACAGALADDDPELDDLVYAAAYRLPDSERLVLVFSLVPNGAVNGDHRVIELDALDCSIVGRQTI